MKLLIYIIKEWFLVNRLMYFTRLLIFVVIGTVFDLDEGSGIGVIIVVVVSFIFVVFFIIVVFFVRRRF